MLTRMIFCVLAIFVIAHSGCSLCCTPYDYHYVTTGGKHQRADRVHGRVGSIFSDPGAMEGGTIIEGPMEESVEVIEDFESSIDLGDSDQIIIPGADDMGGDDSQVEFAGAREGDDDSDSSLKID